DWRSAVASFSLAAGRTQTGELRTGAALAADEVGQQTVQDPDLAEHVDVDVVRLAPAAVPSHAGGLSGASAEDADTAEDGRHNRSLVKLAHFSSYLDGWERSVLDLL